MTMSWWRWLWRVEVVAVGGCEVVEVVAVGGCEVVEGGWRNCGD